ncbi:TRAP-type mannitol/chloroaromatic compound transport system, small permease component, partial [Dysosmobacter welbionis]
KGSCAEEDDEHHGGGFGGVDQRLIEHLPAELLVEDRQDQGEQGADARGLRGGGDAAEDGAQHAEDQNQRRDQVDQGAGDALLQGHLRQLLGTHGRAPVGMDVADHHQVDDVSQGQAQAGDDGGEEDLADGDLCVRAHGDQHDGGRDQNAQGAAGAHHAAGQGGFVAAAQQHGKRQHA